MRGLTIAVLVLGAGCGRTATIEVLLAAEPGDLPAASAIRLGVGKVEGHRIELSVNEDFDPTDTTIDKDDLWSLLREKVGPIDLATLGGAATLELGQIEVPDSRMNQFRMVFDVVGPNEVNLKDGRICQLDIAAVPATGAKVSHTYRSIEIYDGRKTSVVLDFNVKESIVTTADCAYKLAPAIKIKTVTISGKDTQ